MRKRNVMGKIFGVALLFLVIGAMLPISGSAPQSEALAQEAKTWG